MKKDETFATIRLIDDQPIDDLERDYLGLSPWAKMIAGSAVGTPGPFTIGVHGQWGYGKTTLLKLAKALIERDHPGVVTVWFNAWQFEREAHPLFPLIAAIAHEIERKTKGKKTLEKLQKVGLSLRALARGMKFKGEVGVPLVGRVGVEFDARKALEAEDLLGKQTSPIMAEMMYHSAFATLEEAAGDGGGKDPVKIVVFVDDLDRCHPEKAVYLLESIKLILAQPGFIFVIAVDRQIIETYLEKRYVRQCGEGTGDRGRFYMEKIIQLPIVIPSHRSRFAGFVNGIVGELTERHGADSEPIKALSAIREVIATGAGMNPRSLIRLVNNFLLDCTLWPLIEHEEPYRELTEGLAAALAFNRILQHELGDRYAVLIAGQDLCDAIRLYGIDGLEQFPAKAEPWEEAREGPEGLLRRREEERPLVEVARTLLGRRELVEALRKHGGDWLRDEKLRRVVHEFAQIERAEAGPADFPEPLGTAIREALDLRLDEPIPAARLAEVTRLNLSRTQVTDEALGHLKELLGLKVLMLGDTDVTDAGLKHLAGLTGLQELYLWRAIQVSDDGLAYLKPLSNLRVLNLAHVPVTNGAFKHLTGLAGLQVLDLWNTRVTDSGLKHLTALPGLRTLNVGGTREVTNGGVQCLKDLGMLQKLILGGSAVTDAGLRHLKGLRRLEKLDLWKTEVKGEGLEHLQGLPELKELILGDTNVTDRGLTHLKALAKLQILGLGDAKAITDLGIGHLKGLRDLQVLNLWNTQVTDKGLKHLGELLSLRELNLEGATGVTDTGLKHLEGLAKLRELKLKGTLGVTEQGIRALKAALPQVQVHT